MVPVHDRMPVIVAPADFEDWLTGNTDNALSLVRPYPAEAMQSWPVDRRLSRSVEEGADLVSPLDG